MITNAKAILSKASKENYAIGQFNINNLESTKAILEVANELNSPVILGVSESAVKYIGGYSSTVLMIKGLDKSLKLKIPVVIHFDHGSSIENVKAAIKAGFTSVMLDGSNLPLKKNCQLTTKIVKYAKKFNVTVEGEVGIVGGSENDFSNSTVKYATFEECQALANCGIDMLAASLGSVHGHYIGQPNLGFLEMKTYSSKINIPLVLHGGSGIPPKMIAKAIASGERKINVNTEIQAAYVAGIKRYVNEQHDSLEDSYDMRKLILTYAYPNMKQIVKTKIELFGSQNKA